MQSGRRQKRFITYGKPSKHQGNISASSFFDTMEPCPRSPKDLSDPKHHSSPTYWPESKGERSSSPPRSSARDDISTKQDSAATEIYPASSPDLGDGKSHYHTRRKRRKADSNESFLATGGSADLQTSKDDDSLLIPSSRNILSKPHLTVPPDAVTEPATPSRRRLVDSLGIMERSPGESVSFNTSDWQLAFTPSHSSCPGGKDSSTSPNESETHNDDSQQSATLSPAHLRNSTVTYARQRSFLNEHSISASTGIQGRAPILQNGSFSEQTGSGPEAADQTHLCAEYEEIDDSGSVRGIHELRQAGENALFRGAVDLIFEDIEDACNWGSDPCNGFAQLCAKLSDPHLARRFSDYGFEKRFLQCATGDLDVLCTSLALCAYELIRSGRPFSYTSIAPFMPALLDLSSGLLSVDDDILSLAAKCKRRVVYKSVQASMPRLSSLIHGQQSASKISPRIVALRCIQSILSNCQESGDGNEAIPTKFLGQLVKLLIQGIHSGVESVSGHPESYQVLVLALSILEAYTVLSGPLVNKLRDTYRPLSQLSNILNMGAHERGNNPAQQILVLYIRVILNVTNNDPSLCDAFSKPDLVEGLVNVVRAGFGEVSEGTFPGDNALDVVILALGTLINLTEQCEPSRPMFLTSTLDSVPLLDLLLGVFSASVGSVPEARSIVEVHLNVAIGYLGILLVTLSLDREARFVIQKSLEGKGLTVIVSTVKEFLQYHHKVEQDLASETKKTAGNGFTIRLQKIMSEIEESGVTG